VLEYGRLCAGEDLRRLSAVIDLDLAPYAGLLAEHAGERDPPPLPRQVAEVWARLLDRRSP
jgi:hypothetical protein